METILDEKKIGDALLKALPFLTHQERDRAIAALSAAGGVFEEVALEGRLGMNYSVSCPDICIVAEKVTEGKKLRVFTERKETPAA